MMRTKALALGVAVVIGSLSPTIASAADTWFPPAPPTGYTAFGYPYGPAYPFGYFGYNGYFGEPALYGAYHGDGSCYLAQHRVRTPYGWRSRLTQVCG